MLQKSNILGVKLQGPRTPDAVARTRLDPLLEEIGSKRISTVVAGAGYGKTTFVSLAASRLNENTVWYRLDASDEDFATFLGYLIAGVRKIHPGFGNESEQLLREAGCAPEGRETILARLAVEMEDVADNDLFIILDDFHEIQRNPDIKQAVVFFLTYFPSTVHLVLISRVKIDLPLSRFKARRRVVEVTEADLAFTPRETGLLYRGLFDVSLDPAELDILQSCTGGWVSGLILFYHGLARNNSFKVKDFPKRLKGSQGEILGYLEENIYTPMPPREKEFLLKTSILPRMNPDLCNQLLSIENSGKILEGLVDNHLFTHAAEEDERWYEYHQLLRDFLQMKLAADFGGSAIRELQRRAGVLLEKRGELENALEHYLAGKCMEEAGRLLGVLARPLIKEGRVHRIKALLKKIPGPSLERNPWALYLKGGAMELSGDSSEAVREYEKAHRIFKEQNREDGATLCLMDLALYYFMVGDFQRSESKHSEILSKKGVTPYQYVATSGYLIVISAESGKLEEADRYGREAGALLPTIENDNIRASMRAWLTLCGGVRDLAAGELRSALEAGREARRIFERIGHYRLLAMSLQVLSCAHCGLGGFSRGLEIARDGMQILRSRGIRDISLPWLRFCAGENLLEMDEAELAIHEGEESLAYFRQLGSAKGMGLAHLLLHRGRRRSGDRAGAEENLRAGLAALKKVRLPLVEGELKQCLAVMFLERGELEEAERLIHEASEMLGFSRLRAIRTGCLRVRCHLERRDRERALKEMISLLESRIPGSDGIIAGEKAWITPPLVEIYARGRARVAAREILQEIGPPAIADLRRLLGHDDPRVKKSARLLLGEIPSPPAPGLSIHLFGKFRVEAAGKRIPDRMWRSKKALMLFKYLVYIRPRGCVPRDVLMELLWPGEPPEKTTNRLHVALSSLRKILEPDIWKGAPSSYVIRKDDAYGISLGADGRVDVERFTSELERAASERNPEEALARYLKTESLYTGDFLEEDRYVDWCIEARERFQADYLSAVREIIRLHEDRKEYSRCADYAEKHLEKDKYAEDMYRKLMRWHVLMGNKTRALRVLDRCVANIVNDLDCPLSDETEALIRKLKNQNQSKFEPGE